MKRTAPALALGPPMALLLAACSGSAPGEPTPPSSSPTGEAILVREYAPERQPEATLLPTPTHEPRAEAIPPVLPSLPGRGAPTLAPRTSSSPAVGDGRGSAPSKPIPTPAQRVFYVGDSLAVGSQQSLVESLPSRQVHRETRVGMTTAEGVKVARNASPSDMLVVDLGTNDFSPKTFARGVENMMSVASGRTVVWVNVARAGAENINRVLQRTSRQYPNLVVLDWRRASMRHPEWLADDGVHYVPAGYLARGAYIADAIG